MLEKLIAQVAPHVCLVCGGEGGLLCTECQPAAIIRKRSTCFLCNKLTDGFRPCENCRRKTALKGVFVASHYEGPIKVLVQMFKYQRAIAGCRAAARLIDLALPQALPVEAVTWVPASTKRRRFRGYNQAAAIAKELAKLRGLPYRSLLIRRGHSRQVGQKRRVRIEQMEQTMSTRRSLGYDGWLVVDDVLTTGATLNEAGRALEEAGAGSVWGVVLAKH